MAAHKITLIPGDGIGPEIMEAARRVLEATGVEFTWDHQQAGSEMLKKNGDPLPDGVIDSIKKNKVALKGPITTPVGSGIRSINSALRMELGLYACQRPFKWFEGLPSGRAGTDIVVFREISEDLFAGIEFERGSAQMDKLRELVRSSLGAELAEDAGVSLKPISPSASERIVRAAFEYAQMSGRSKVTVGHKANVMLASDGEFLEAAKRVAHRYTDIELEELLIDNLCYRLVADPPQFEVLALPNLYGDIVSDICAALAGGLGMAPGVNLGECYAVFEAGHGSAPKHAGKNRANPMGLMLSAAMMLGHIGECDAAGRVERAVASVIFDGRYVTYDISKKNGGDNAASTSQVADAIIKELK